MRPLLFILIAAIMLGGVVGFVANVPGALIVPLGGWQVEISLALFVGILLLVLLALWILILCARLILQAPKEQWREWQGWFRGRRLTRQRTQQRTQQRDATRAWAQAVLVLYQDTNNSAALQAALAKAKRALPEAALTYLLRGASMQDEKTRTQIYNDMTHTPDPETQLFGWVGLLLQARKSNYEGGDNKRAADFAAQISALMDDDNKEWLQHIL
ncbi:MAG: hypothetical protein HAW64_03750 [Alphaproteobacteria bacterium]|nr:hypothetical protein [Alphaproteobacteria bacterium]